MVKWLGISALSVAAFVVFMTAGSGRAAEPSSAAKAPSGKAEAPTVAKEGAPAAAPAKLAAAAATGKSDKDAKDAKDAKDSVPKATGVDAREAQKTASPTGPAGQHRTKSKRKHDGSASEDEPELPPGQGPPPPSPLTVNDLHQEANRERGPGGDFNAPPRVKLEQLLSEVGKARQSLHDDTLKLEALSGNEPSRGGESAAADAPAPAGPAQPPQKNPLDVLAKALRGIKPEQAGPIVARLDKGLAATVLLKMPPADAGKIMGALKPEVAAELATQIAMRAPSPQPGGKR